MSSDTTSQNTRSLQINVHFILTAPQMRSKKWDPVPRRIIEQALLFLLLISSIHLVMNSADVSESISRGSLLWYFNSVLHINKTKTNNNKGQRYTISYRHVSQSYIASHTPFSAHVYNSTTGSRINPWRFRS